MSIQAALTRTTERMIRFLEDHSKTDYNGNMEDFLPMLQTIESIFPQWVLLTCPVRHIRSRFITENCTSILDISPAFFKDSVSPEYIFSRIHDDDLQDVHQCYLYVDEFLKNRMPEEYPKIRYAIQYRFMRKDGSHITLHDEKGSMDLKDGNVLYYTMIKDITQEVIFSGVKLDIYKKGATFEKIDSYMPQTAKTNLSKRETELVDLLRRGLSTKEMAYRLNISQHTVRNIKQKMFEKHKVNNVIELLNKTIHYN